MVSLMIINSNALQNTNGSNGLPNGPKSKGVYSRVEYCAKIKEIPNYNPESSHYFVVYHKLSYSW